jgi:hypothetical protein
MLTSTCTCWLVRVVRDDTVPKGFRPAYAVEETDRLEHVHGGHGVRSWSDVDLTK